MDEEKKIEGFTIAVISDTHGRLTPALTDVLSGADHIFHAGDMDTPKFFNALKAIAPVTAVRGNMDRGGWARRFPEVCSFSLAGFFFHMRHNPHQLDLDPAAAGFDAVICGHLHQPLITQKNGVWLINPGSPYFPRNGHSPSAAMIVVREGKLVPHLVAIEVENGALKK